MKKKSGKKWFFIVGAIIIVAAAGYFGYSRLQANKQAANATTNYRTQAVSRGSITSYVSAVGNIRTNQSVTINWQTSGIISKVDVTPGQVIPAGTVLAELDPNSLPQSILNAQTALASDQKALNDLLNSNVARANAEVALIQSEQNLVNAQKAAQSKLYQRASDTTIQVAQANLIMAQNALDNASTIYNKNKARSTTDPQYAAALSQFASAQQKFDTAQLNLQYAQSLPDPLSVQLANANVDLAQANYLDAKRNWEAIKDGPNPVDVAAAQAKVAADQTIINEAKPTSPIAGTVTVINSKPGDLVSANTVGFQIDDMSHMYIDVSVSEVDVNKVQNGQKVDLTFDAIPNKTYQGVVSDIASVGTVSSNVVNYNVTVELMEKDPLIKPGMTSSANIEIPGAQNALLVPNQALRTVNNQRVVYVDQNGTLFPVPVTLGDASATQTVVTGGPLREGELIVLNPPADASLASRQSSGFGIFGRLFGGPAVRTTGGFNGGNGNFNRSGTGGNSGFQRPAGD